MLSIRDPHLLNPAISPLLTSANELTGFLPVDFWDSMNFKREPSPQELRQSPLFKVIESNYNRFCQDISQKPKDSSHPPCNSLIPAMIHFIWIGSPLPKQFSTIIDTWQKCHPRWSLKIWNDHDVENFFWSNGYIKWLFEQAKTFAEKSDILRYDILYQFGGIYSDIDILCYKPFDDLISGSFDFFAGFQKNTIPSGSLDSITLSLIGAARHHPIIKQCLDTLISKEEAPDKSLFERTGPGCFSLACQKGLSSGKKDTILILPCSYFYPLPFFENHVHKTLTAQEIKTHFIAPETMALHLWAGTWYT